MVMAEMAKPRETFILARGDTQAERQGAAGVPAMLPPLPDGRAAQSPDAGQVAGRPRSSADRARRRQSVTGRCYFGNGIVKTQEDFGVQGEPPSHPELLDWLATEFIRTGWDVKAMQRLIVTSATYRQSSRVTPALLEKDPENRLLARGPRVRLPAEIDSRHRARRERAARTTDRRAERACRISRRDSGKSWRSATASRVRRTSRATGRDLYRRGMYTLLEAHRAAGVACDLRRARSREVHGAPRADEHAAAGAGAAERSDVSSKPSRALAAARAARRRQGRRPPAVVRVPPGDRSQADDTGDQGPADAARRPPRRAIRQDRAGGAMKLLGGRRVAARPRLDAAELAA